MVFVALFLKIRVFQQQWFLKVTLQIGRTVSVWDGVNFPYSISGIQLCSLGLFWLMLNSVHAAPEVFPFHCLFPLCVHPNLQGLGCEWSRSWEGTQPGQMVQLTKGLLHMGSCLAIKAQEKEKGRLIGVMGFIFLW